MFKGRICQVDLVSSPKRTNALRVTKNFDASLRWTEKLKESESSSAPKNKQTNKQNVMLKKKKRKKEER